MRARWCITDRYIRSEHVPFRFLHLFDPPPSPRRSPLPPTPSLRNLTNRQEERIAGAVIAASSTPFKGGSNTATAASTPVSAVNATGGPVSPPRTGPDSASGSWRLNSTRNLSSRCARACVCVCLGVETCLFPCSHYVFNHFSDIFLFCLL